MNAEKTGKKLTEMDFKFFFFPWWKEPAYRLDNAEFTINSEMEDYFKELEIKHGIVLDSAQKRWYVNSRKINGENMFREYPSTPDEPFHVAVEGAYYGSQMAKVREQKRIMLVPYDSRLTVETWWDLGMNDTNVILFTQSYGNEIRFIDYYENTGEGLAHYVSVLKDKGYIYSKHNFPHDIEIRDLSTGISRRQTLLELNLQPIRTIERTKDILDDIEQVRKMFSRFYFDEKHCSKLIDALDNYRKDRDPVTGEFKNRPRHDKWSHACDAMRLVAKGTVNYSLTPNSGRSENLDTAFF